MAKYAKFGMKEFKPEVVNMKNTPSVEATSDSNKRVFKGSKVGQEKGYAVGVTSGKTGFKKGMKGYSGGGK